MQKGVGSEGEEEEDALKRRGFRDRMDLRLGAMMQLMYEREVLKNRVHACWSQTPESTRMDM